MQGKVKKKTRSQRGEVEVILFAIIIIFGLLVTGSLQTFNSSRNNNLIPSDNSGWIYQQRISQPVQKSQQKLQEGTIYYISIPKQVVSITGAPGSPFHALGALPSKVYNSPQWYLQKHHVTVTLGRNNSSLFSKVPQAYADTVPPDSNNTLSAYLPGVGDQGQLGSCTTWASGYYMMGLYANEFGYYPPGGYDPTLGAGANLGGFAPMYLYSQQCNKSTPKNVADCGTSWGANIGILNTQGIDQRQNYTQGDYDYKDQPTAVEKAYAAFYKSSQIETIFSGGPFNDTKDIQAAEMSIKYAISNGSPVGITTQVLPSFDNASPQNQSFIIDSTVGKSRGLHAVMAYAYDKNGVWIINQWGTGWGLNGNGELSWNYFDSEVSEAYTFAPVVPTTTPSPYPSTPPIPSPSRSPIPTIPGPNPCATLNLNIDPVNCGLNGSGIGFFCGGNCGVAVQAGNPNTLYECQGTQTIGTVACSPKCITCSGAPHADQCGADTSVCGGGAPSGPITTPSPAAGTQCRASNGACTSYKLCSANCQSCGSNNDCPAGEGCCH